MARKQGTKQAGSSKASASTSSETDAVAGGPLGPGMLDALTGQPVASPADLFDLWEELSARPVPNELGDHTNWDRFDREFSFRGQPQDYGTLAPSFQRVFTQRRSSGAATIIEESLIDDFRVHYGKLSIDNGMPLPDRLSGDDYLTLSVMQHYGVPTRLLDWTSSFWTAVYFACSGDADADGELWYYDRALFHGPTSRRRLFEFDPDITPRMESQAAHFTYSVDILDDHAPLFHELGVERSAEAEAGAAPQGLQRVVVSSSAKERTLRFLDEQLGVTASTVFPDVEGLGRFLRWQLDTLLTRLL